MQPLRQGCSLMSLRPIAQVTVAAINMTVSRVVTLLP